VLLCSDAINEHNERENARVVAEATGRTQPPLLRADHLVAKPLRVMPHLQLVPVELVVS